MTTLVGKAETTHGGEPRDWTMWLMWRMGNPKNETFGPALSSNFIQGKIFSRKVGSLVIAGRKMIWPAVARLFIKKLWKMTPVLFHKMVSHFKNEWRASKSQIFVTPVMVRTRMYTQLFLLFTVLSAWFGLVRPRGQDGPRTDQYSNYSSIRFNLDQSNFCVVCNY